MHIDDNVELAPRTTLNVGGRARWLARIDDESNLTAALDFASERRARVFVLGGGSNVVVPDGGIDGLVLAMNLRGIRTWTTGALTTLVAGAGEPWDAVVRHAVELGLRGLECLSGIPGLVGATPIQNVGAYGQEVAETLVHVRAFDREQRAFVSISNGECEFGYRESRFKSRDRDRFIVTEVTFRLAQGPSTIRYPELARALEPLGRPPTLREVRDAVLALRRSKSMLHTPDDPNGRSCGSFFVNPVVTRELADDVERRLRLTTMPRYGQADGRVKLSAAWLIERSGLEKGTRSGNVGLSSRHALALVCHAGATATELLAFAERVRNQVFERTGVALLPEPVIW